MRKFSILFLVNNLKDSDHSISTEVIAFLKKKEVTIYS